MTMRVAAGSRSINVLTALLVLALLLPAAQLGRAAGELISVIVREAPGAGDVPERLVESTGGTVGLRLSIINGFAAELPRGAVEWLEASPAIEAVTPDAPLHLQGESYSPGADVGSMQHTADIIGASRYWKAGIFGTGIDVAIIDSGVSPVRGLDEKGKVVRGPDLSFESQAPNLRYLDTFGHGTFMAGLIAGHDSQDRRGNHEGDDRANYAGVAPGARLVSIKVADAHGQTDVSQVIAAIDWVVQHRRDPGFNIRVLNLSFGTYSAQPYTLDPLAFAAEVAWQSGIFVVVAAGNDSGTTGRLMDPAMDPFVMAVGAANANGTVSVKDDVLLAFSARGDGVRNPDLVAPGKSLQGLRVPGSWIDVTFPYGRINDRFFRGSGTSQAAALMSGAAALVIQQRPRITPDELKALLTSTAVKLPAADPRGQGAGMISLRTAFRTPTTPSVQRWQRSTGTGSLELARGGHHLVADGVPLVGERDIFGADFNSTAMAAATLAGATWSGGVWNGTAWTGNEWSANEWSTVAWSGVSWSGNEWSSYTWSANEWSGNEWSANEWSANEWSANEWSANEWSANEWSTSGWLAAGWPSLP
jgi:subtilase family protein